MIKKRETCLYCGEKMESITAKKKFCSPLHKLYWHRENKSNKGILHALINTTPVYDSSNMNRTTIDELAGGVSTTDQKQEVSEEPKWKLKNPTMKVPDGLTSLQRRIWITNWEKENKKNRSS